MNYLHAEFDLQSTHLVQVTLAGNAANVMLMDDYNFERYKEGRAFSHYGGYFTKSPVTVKAPFSGHWHVVVDLGGAEGDVNAAIAIVSQAA